MTIVAVKNKRTQLLFLSDLASDPPPDIYSNIEVEIITGVITVELLCG